MVNTTPPPLYLGEKNRYVLYRRLGWPQIRSRQVRKISPPPGLYLQTVQPVVSRYTAYGIPKTQENIRYKQDFSLLLHRASCRFTKYHTTNKCTNCMSFILNYFFKTLSLLLHVSIAYRLSSSGSTYNS